VVHGSEVTLLITWIAALFFVARLDFVFSSNADAATVWSRPAPIRSSAAHYAPTLKNSRSTRRDRRNQHSTCFTT
jgi:hypothetical protein